MKHMNPTVLLLLQIEPSLAWFDNPYNSSRDDSDGQLSVETGNDHVPGPILSIPTHLLFDPNEEDYSTIPILGLEPALEQTGNDALPQWNSSINITHTSAPPDYNSRFQAASEQGATFDETLAILDKISSSRYRLTQLENEMTTLYEELRELEDRIDGYDHDLFSISLSGTRTTASLSQITELDLASPAMNDLTRDYLDKVEEVEGANGDVEDLENKYLQVSGDATLRGHSFPLSLEVSKLVNGYPRPYAEALTNLHNVRDTLFGIGDQFPEQAHFTEPGYLYELRDALLDNVMDILHEETVLVRVAREDQGPDLVDYQTSNTSRGVRGCGKSFSRQDNLLRHVKKLHGCKDR
ncbi:uncharacterized protein PAC_13660 [Phialocephala subalpina]|uniref:C2H2-type domain-containing protein n=1 Tax=Phialocephala subalpina TaxID=576137 RepID=A0A1L7XFF5_9HELO|nr:uncharacterized protein PAC_13660 [Phialocephala subalpina]